MELEQFNFIKENRGYVRTKVTKFTNKLSSTVDQFNTTECNVNISDLKELRDKLLNCNVEISRYIWQHEKDRKLLDKELSECDQYDEKIVSTIRKVEARRNLLSSAHVAPSPVGSEGHRISSQMKLPQLTLPRYGHEEGENLDEFFKNFEGITNKYSISPFEKFVLLEGQLYGEALPIIKSLRGDDKAYDTAKSLLIDAFASPMTQKFEVVEKLSNLNLSPGDSCYKFASEMRIVIQSFRALDIDVDTVLQFFIWNAMPYALQNQLINITNTNKPTLKEIEDNLFKAIDRYNAFTKRRQNNVKTTKSQPTVNMAVNIDSRRREGAKQKFNPCVLCNLESKLSDHPIHLCNAFKTPEAKIEKLKSLSACLKCAHTNHTTEKCLFKFRKQCYHCSGSHFTFLCSHSDRKTGGSEGANVNSLTAGTISVDCRTLDSSGNNCFLPTFSAAIPDGNTIRCLKDSGAQCSFIVERVATREKFRVLQENLKLNVNGFNSSKHYTTKLVEVSVVIAGKVHKFSAVCVPSINICLHIEGLDKIVHSLVKQKLTIADKFLLDPREEEKIGNIDLIFGANAAHCLSEKSHSFGKSSSYIDSPLGIMLIGDATNFLRDVCSLNKPSESDLNLETFHTETSDVSCPEAFDNSSETYSMPVSIETKNFGDPIDPKVKDWVVIDESGRLHQNKVNFAVKDIIDNSSSDVLDERCSRFLAYDEVVPCESSHENETLVNFTIDNITRDHDGRLVVPIMWNSRNAHLLTKNFNLCKRLLMSNLNKLQKNNDKLLMVDKVFKDQLDQGILKLIPNLNNFMNENPQCSFLGHMPIFKMNKETTKCRIVLLSNLCEKSSNTSFSHNQTILPGPNLNKKLSTSIIQVRFDKYLLCYDLIKAFHQIGISDNDGKKLCLLWYRNVTAGDFDLVGYQSSRVPFGLRCSPSLLMISLYYILMQSSTENNDPQLVELKRHLYDLVYMDNGSFTSNNSDQMEWALNYLPKIYEPFKFGVQQIFTNDLDLQNRVDNETESDSTSNSKLLGLNWNRAHDTISCESLTLNLKANTKRTVLKSIAANFDLFNIVGPLLNRARLFLHSLQCDTDLGWDTKLSEENLAQWKNIVRQFNSAPTISIDRSFGSRSGEYYLIAYTDSSKELYGAVVYLFDVESNKCTFVLAKNRVIGRNLESKSIPSLELQAISLGVETLLDLYHELSGSSCVIPINISKLLLFTDSMVCLAWLQSYVSKFDKMNTKTVFVQNRLHNIGKLCETFPISFYFCSGERNPADHISRPCSYKILSRSNYHTGPDVQSLITTIRDSQCVVIPNPLCSQDDATLQACVEQVQRGAYPGDTVQSYAAQIMPTRHARSVLLDVDRVSSFFKVIRIMYIVMKICNNFKKKIANKSKSNLNVRQNVDLYSDSFCSIILQDQHKHFPEILSYFNASCSTKSDIPLLVSQLNLFIDSNGIIRIKCKFRRWRDDVGEFPILLSKESRLTKLIIVELHERLNHGGCYVVMSELRKRYYLTHCFSAVKRVLKECVTCRRVNSRTIQLNQNSYRDFRINPSNIPFRSTFVDFIGPYFIYSNKRKVKVYLLCITCLWSRAINLKVCVDLTVKSFIRALQLHAFEYGIPQLVLSDSGSQLIAGGNLIMDFVKDVETQNYFAENGMKTIEFQQYPKGCNQLGGLVESCVKLVKRLIYGAMKKNVLDSLDFDFLTAQTIHLVNRRPLAFKEGLRDMNVDAPMPSAITPEILLKGHELVSVNFTPYMTEIGEDPTWDPNVAPTIDHIRSSHSKLMAARQCLVSLYNEEFFSNLMSQSTNRKYRYKPVDHIRLQIGDIVLLREPLLKPMNYPMGIVRDVTVNDLDEVTSVTLYKGATRELVKRHVSSLILFLSRAEYMEYSAAPDEAADPPPGADTSAPAADATRTARPARDAAVRSRAATEAMLADGSV